MPAWSRSIPRMSKMSFPALQVRQRFFVVRQTVTTFAAKAGRHGIQVKHPVLLLEDCSHVEHAIYVQVRWRVPVDRGPGGSLEILARRLDARIGRGRIVAISESEDAPAAIGLDGVSEPHPLGVGEADSRRRVKAHADDEALGQVLMLGSPQIGDGLYLVAVRRYSGRAG